MTAFASAGMGTSWSTVQVIFACVPCGSMDLMVPTLTPETRTSSPG